MLPSGCVIASRPHSRCGVCAKHHNPMPGPWLQVSAVRFWPARTRLPVLPKVPVLPSGQYASNQGSDAVPRCTIFMCVWISVRYSAPGAQYVPDTATSAVASRHSRSVASSATVPPIPTRQRCSFGMPASRQPWPTWSSTTWMSAMSVWRVEL